MICPLCSKDIGEYYTSPKIVLAQHVLDYHLANPEDYDENGVPAIKCLCGKEFRGVGTFARHLLSLEGHDLDEHKLLFSLSTPIEVIRRIRGGHYSTPRIAARIESKRRRNDRSLPSTD